MTGNATLPLEDFIQAVQAQLDRAQEGMAIKARTLNMGLTFAIKDVSMDLRAHVDVSRNEVRIKPAGPGDKEASVFHLVFTTITRPALEETAQALSDTPDARPLDDLGDELSPEDRRRLEWLGVRSVDKLERIKNEMGERGIERVTNLPVDRLRKAFDRMARPMVDQILPQLPKAGDPDDLPTMVRVRGRNMLREGVPARAIVNGEPVSVLKASEDELLLSPRPHQLAGELRLSHGDAQPCVAAFDLTPYWPTVAPPSTSVNGGGAR
jgi:hypothetical protein